MAWYPKDVRIRRMGSDWCFPPYNWEVPSCADRIVSWLDIYENIQFLCGFWNHCWCTIPLTFLYTFVLQTQNTHTHILSAIPSCTRSACTALSLPETPVMSFSSLVVILLCISSLSSPLHASFMVVLRDLQLGDVISGISPRSSLPTPFVYNSALPVNSAICIVHIPFVVYMCCCAFLPLLVG